MISLERLKEVLDKHFGEPFIAEDFVTARLVPRTTGHALEIKIGPRDICLEADGRVSAAGTDLCDG